MKSHFFGAVLVTFVAAAQTPIQSEAGGAPRLAPSDWGLLESVEPRNDLGCTVRWSQPQLQFDLRFNPRYEAQIPLSELSPGGKLSVLIRVTPQQGNPKYFVQRWMLPEQEWTEEQGSKAQFQIQGGIDIGPGTYQVDWLVRDIAGRACSYRQTLSAPDIEGLHIGPHQVSARSEVSSSSEVCTNSFSEGELKPVHLYINFNSARPGSSSLDERDRDAYLSLIRVFSRECSIPTLHLTVFDLERKKLLFESEPNVIDYQALESALNKMEAGTIGLDALREEQSSFVFLQTMLEQSAKPSNEAVVFMGPAAPVYSGVSGDLAPVACPNCLYLHYEPAPHGGLWMDVVGKWMGRMQARKITIRQPKDLLKALPEIGRVLGRQLNVRKAMN